MGDLWDGMRYGDYLSAARSCGTRREFERSAFFARHGSDLRSFLLTPWVRSDWARDSMPDGPAQQSAPDPPPSGHPLPGTLRVVQWNIEKGLQLERIRRRLTEDPELAAADLYCLNEVDVGMARSGANANVGEELARALGCHLVYLPSYIECTKGPGPDALAPGENERGLHGLAILSRHPVREARGSVLPECWDYFDYPIEKRYGFRQVLRARIDWDGRDVLVATTHLEVRNDPACRAGQMRAALRALEEDRADWGGPSLPILLTGDLNTNTFRRGGLLRTIREFLRIVRTPSEQLAAELVTPFAHEPLFAKLDRAGYSYRPFTDGAWTAETLLGSAEDLEVLPKPIADHISRTFRLGSRFLQMRLDWIVTNGFVAAGPPRTVSPEVSPHEPASDHWIVWSDLAPAAGRTSVRA